MREAGCLNGVEPFEKKQGLEKALAGRVAFSIGCNVSAKGGANIWGERQRLYKGIGNGACIDCGTV